MLQWDVSQDNPHNIHRIEIITAALIHPLDTEELFQLLLPLQKVC